MDIFPFVNSGRFKIIVNNFIQPRLETKQILFPKSKKVRIRKKWAKRSYNFKSFYIDEFLVIGDTIFVTQTHYDKLMIYFDVTSIKSTT